MSTQQRLPVKVAFLIGSDTYSTRLSIDAVCKVPGVKPVAILMDTAPVPFSRRFRNLRGNIRREGLGYLFHRVLVALDDALEQQAKRVVSRSQVLELLRKTFPARSFTVGDAGKRWGFPVLEVGSLNSPKAAAALRESAADLGIVLGTRILKRSTFAVPRLGCLNLHKGKVPDFRGMPPGFWELYEGSQTAGVTVHFVDDSLDTGDVIGTREVAIHEKETELSLQAKLDLAGTRLLAECVAALALGTAVRNPQPKSHSKPRTKPTRRQRLELKRRTPHAVTQPQHVRRIVKTFVYLAFYYLGIYGLVRFIRRKTHVSRAAVLLYHRVNDYSVDPLTTSTESFAEHLLLLKHRYCVRPASWLVERLREKEPISSDTVVIHFDDCYREVFTQAAPLLQTAGLPATAFISSGYVGTNRAFAHDVEKYPFVYENMSAEEVRGLVDMGFEIGAHTVSHSNLSTLLPEQVEQEVRNSCTDLEGIIGQPVEFFSFPFGRQSDVSEKARKSVSDAGIKALFSAHGGFVSNRSDLLDIPRRGVSSAHRPLDLMMEIEGFSLRTTIRLF